MGTEALAKAKSVVGELEYTEEQDKVRKILYKLPKEVTTQEEEMAQDIYFRERNIFKNLLIPGKDRYMMPTVPSKSERLRNSEKPGLYPFCTLPVDDVERALIMRTF